MSFGVRELAPALTAASWLAALRQSAKGWSVPSR
jgi:hypothetical protein